MTIFKDLNKIIEEELKTITLMIGIEDLNKVKYEKVIKILDDNKINFKIEKLTLENPKKIIKARFPKKQKKKIISEIKKVLEK